MISYSQAQSCKELFTKQSVVKNSVEFEASAVDIPLNKLRKHFLPEIDRARNLTLDSGLTFPNNPIRITIHPNFNFEGPVSVIKVRMDILDITVPYQHLYDKKPYPRSQEWRNYSRNPIHSLPSFHHELGHAILKYNVINGKSLASQFFLAEASIQELAAEGKRLIKETSSLSQSAMEKIMIPFAERFKKKEKEIGLLQQQNFGKYLKGLNELFADVISVLLSKRPDAISLSMPRSPINMAKSFSYKSRDFSNSNNELYFWQGPKGDIHNFFSPARYFLYENYLKYPIYMEGLKRKDLLGNLVRSIEEFSEISKEELNEMSLHQANQKFISIFKSIMEPS